MNKLGIATKFSFIWFPILRGCNQLTRWEVKNVNLLLFGGIFRDNADEKVELLQKIVLI